MAEMYLSIIKSMCNNPTANSWKVENFPSDARNDTRIPTPTAPMQHNTGNPSQSNLARKGNKGHQKEEVEWFLFADDMILCVETLKIPHTQKLN